MEYRKKALVIKQILQGFTVGKTAVNAIARLETDGEVADFYLSVINLCPISGGEYFAYLSAGDNLYEFSLGKRPSSIIKQITPCKRFENGFSVGIAFIKDNLPQIIAFNKTEDCESGLSDLKKRVAEKCLFNLKNKKELDGATTTCQPSPVTVYDDEAVATEDYFEKERLYKNERRERLRIENELPDCNCQETQTKSQTGVVGAENEKNFSPDEQPPKYYQTVKKHLDDIFFKFPEEECLRDMFPKSRWAKIRYSREKYYVVGIMFDDEREKYICYGVPEKYSDTPPATLNGYCSFIPLSVFDMKGDGYWIIFQDAHTGKCIKNSPLSVFS